VSWVRLDDGFAESPAMLEAGPIAYASATWFLAYSSRHLTDGFVHESVTRCNAWASSRGGQRSVNERLVVAGFWEPVEGGYQIVKWNEFLQKSSEVLEKRAASAKRQQDWRERQKKKRNAVTTPVTDDERNAPPDPPPGGEGVLRTPLPSKGKTRNANGTTAAASEGGADAPLPDDDEPPVDPDAKEKLRALIGQIWENGS
jgi:hypothetical protein